MGLRDDHTQKMNDSLTAMYNSRYSKQEAALVGQSLGYKDKNLGSIDEEKGRYG